MFKILFVKLLINLVENNDVFNSKMFYGCQK